jgi:hypothetical protein
MPLSAEERLILVRVKVKRAKKHLVELETAAEPYRDSYTHVGVSKNYSEVSQFPPKLRKLPVVSFEMLAIAGDVLHNLRSSLDHVIYHLALVRNPKTSREDLRDISFPISKDFHAYKSGACRKVKRLVEPRAIQFIDTLKPYKGGNDALWRLHELNNIDKHRRLIPSGRNILCEGEGFYGYYWLKDNNAPFTRLDVPERQKDTKLTGFKSLRKLQAAQGKALIPTLHQLTDFVEILVEKFAPFLAKT